MAKLVSKCGIDCGACPWGPFPRKGMTAHEFEQYKNTAKQILGYMPIKTPCVTCQIPDEKIPEGSKLPNRKCLIRRCVDRTGVANCAYCSRFPCNTVEATAGAWNRESIEAKLCEPLSEEQYHAFVEPFEGISRLKAIRDLLKPGEIMEPAGAPAAETRIADFPENMPFSKEKAAAFKAVHTLLSAIGQSSLGMRNTDTFAQQQNLKKLKAPVMRFLWILGGCGKFEKEKSRHLEVDASSYIANRGSEKTLAVWHVVKDEVFKVLSGFGVCCERVVLKGVKEEDLATGTGYLRSKGWVMRMSFEERIGGVDALEALQTYIRRLDEKYGKKAFQRFREADMQILLEA